LQVPLPFEPGTLAPKVKSKSINQPFSTPPRAVSPATAWGNRARGLERELKGIGATQEEGRKNQEEIGD